MDISVVLAMHGVPPREFPTHKIIVITPMMTGGGTHSEVDIPRAVKNAKKIILVLKSSMPGPTRFERLPNLWPNKSNVLSRSRHTNLFSEKWKKFWESDKFYKLILNKVCVGG